MSQKTMPAHRDYPDPEASVDLDPEATKSADAEPSYDGPDVAYDEIDAEQDNADQMDRDIFNLWPAPDLFPETLFDDLPKKALVAGPGHGDS